MLRGMILDELVTMWKEAKVTCFKVLPGIRVKNRGMPQKNLSGVSPSRPNLKLAPVECTPQALPLEQLEEELAR
jgi:hypothetical protein